MSWKTNTLIEWSTDNGSTWIKVTDHGRSPLSVGVQRIENSQRMVNGTMRRYTVSKKRNFSCTWDNIPDKATSFLANGSTSGVTLEEMYNSIDGPFLMRLRSGSDQGVNSIVRSGTVDDSDNERVFTVVFTSFDKEIKSRNKNFDLYTISITLEEV